MNHIKNNVTPAKAEPGAEAAEPSPGETDPCRTFRCRSRAAERMYRDAAKKLADEGAADLDQLLSEVLNVQRAEKIVSVPVSPLLCDIRGNE